jgi:hypothetical protein
MKTLLIFALLAGCAFAQTTAITDDGNGTTTITEPDSGVQTTITCGDVANVGSCFLIDTTVENLTSHFHSRRAYFKSIQSYCKQHKGMKWKDCHKAVGPYMDPSL